MRSGIGQADYFVCYGSAFRAGPISLQKTVRVRCRMSLRELCWNAPKNVVHRGLTGIIDERIVPGRNIRSIGRLESDSGG